MPGNIYLNQAITSLSEILALLFIQTPLISFLGPKRSFQIMSVVAALGASAMIGLGTSPSILTSMIISMITKVGVGSAFSIMYVLTFNQFNTTQIGTAFMVCNVASRGLSALAPLVNELHVSVPMSGFIVL